MTTEPGIPTRHNNYPRGEQRYNAKLTAADVLKIRALAASGERWTDIYPRYPQVSKININHIINRRRWKHLLPGEGA